MARTLPKNKSPKQQLIIACTQDYFGTGSMVRANQIALWLMGKRSGIHLTKEEVSDMWAIKENMTDQPYIKSFL